MTMYILTLLTAITLSAVAEYFSIMGLIAIFAAAPIPIAVMGIALGMGKLVAASWVYRNWQTAPSTIKYYFTVAVVVLSLITSMGIFGYLSKAHMDQSLISGDVLAKISIYDEKIKTSKENIDANRKALKQLDEVVDQTMARSTDEKGADKAAQLRRSQSKDRTRLLSDIEAEQKKISQLTEERAPIAAEVRKVEAEVGPIKYIAALIYGDNSDTNTLERAVRWVIITLVFVFDPLAILLLIAANISYKQTRKDEDTELVYVADVGEKPTEQEKQEINFFEDPVTEIVTTKPAEEKEGWSPEMYQRVKQDPNSVKIERSRIHSIPKEILDKVFRK